MRQRHERGCKLNQPRGTLRMILLYLPVSAAYLGSAWLEWERLGQPARTELHHRIAIASWLTACALIGHEIGRAHVLTPVTATSRMPSSAWKKKHHTLV